MRGKKLTAKQLDTFIDALRRSGNVTLSAEAAGTSRAAVYLHRNATDEAGKPTQAAQDLAARWDEAAAEACDRLEGEAWRRAFDGWDEPVFGRVAKDQDGFVGLIHKYDSGLLSLLLKAHKPDKYRERKEISGPNGGPIETVGMTVDEWRARAEQRRQAAEQTLAMLEDEGDA